MIIPNPLNSLYHIREWRETRNPESSQERNAAPRLSQRVIDFFEFSDWYIVKNVFIWSAAIYRRFEMPGINSRL
jgi:hypothetical protein